MIASAAELRVGDMVDSPIGYTGRVVRIERGTVTVEYAGRGGRTEGVYTPEWFMHWPGMLKKTWRNGAQASRR